MRLLCIACLLLLAGPAAAYAADPSIVSREVPLGAARSPSSLHAPALFDMVGLHWRGPGSVDFRTRSVEGRWSGWRGAAPEAEDLPDAGVERLPVAWRLGNPFWTGWSDRIEVRTRGSVSRVRAWFVSTASARVPLRRVSIAGSPAVTPRRSWQADERIVRAAPRYAPTLRFAVVHHTAGSNAYGPGDSAAIVKGIELYHVKANGWNDIGYNFLVDRFGQVFEGRGGGMDRNVIGAHAQGFNTGSVGVALIGMYTSKAPSPEAEQAIARLLAWRLDVAHVDPGSSGLVTSGGNPKYRPGAGVYVRAVSGHRDTDFTSCPGDRLYARLGALTEMAATTGLPKLYDPAVRGSLGKIMRFWARLSQPLAWTVTVSGPGGTRVASRTGVGDRVSWFWDSSTVDSGARYTWAIEAPGVRPARGAFGPGRPPPPALPPPAAAPPAGPPPASGLTIATPSLSPNGDGYQDSTVVRYALAEPSVVTATIEDTLGLTVSMPLASVRQSAGARSFRLDPAVLLDGRYRVVVDARGDSGRRATLRGGLTVSRTLGWLRVDPAFLALSPAGDSTVTISFELTTAAQVTAEIRDHAAQIGIISAEWLEPGSHAVIWNGTLPAGMVAPGLYEIWVTAGTDAGTVTQTVPITVTGPSG